MQKYLLQGRGKGLGTREKVNFYPSSESLKPASPDLVRSPLYLDSFTLEGSLTTRGDNDYLNYDKSNSINLNPNQPVLDTTFGDNQESAKGKFQGGFSRTFDDLTSLTLVKSKNNQASVSVPEPSSFLGLLLGIIGIGYRITSKAVSSKLAVKLKQ